MAGQMEILTREELEEAVLKRKPGERISFREREFEPMDLTGWDLSNMDFTLSSFQNVILNQVNFSGSSVENALFDGCSLHGADFQDANMKTASFRYCDMGECNIKGANLFGAVLEYADLTEISRMNRRSGSGCGVRRRERFWDIKNASTTGWYSC